jgi:uncharacterized protein YegP (UPF0339 family)
VKDASYTIRKTAGDQFYFTLSGGGEEIILVSRMYKTKADAEEGIVTVRLNSRDDDRYLRKGTKDNKFYFVLCAENGERIGKSEIYSTSISLDAGLFAVHRCGLFAPINDVTLIET